jgi:hypothetical protein
VVLLDACRVPSAVCGYKGLHLSALGQAALLRFLEVPETFYPTPPDSAQITRIASGTLKRYLYSPPQSTSTENFDYLDIICDDDDDEDPDEQGGGVSSSPSYVYDRESGVHTAAAASDDMRRRSSAASDVSLSPDMQEKSTTAVTRRYEKVLHFRCFVWILISGCLKKLVAGTVFKPFSCYDEIRDKLIAIRKSSNSSTPTTGPYRYLATSFSQIDLDIWRTKVRDAMHVFYL